MAGGCYHLAWLEAAIIPGMAGGCYHTWHGWRLLLSELMMLEAESRQEEVEQNSKGPVYRKCDAEIEKTDILYV